MTKELKPIDYIRYILCKLGFHRTWEPCVQKREYKAGKLVTEWVGRGYLDNCPFCGKKLIVNKLDKIREWYEI